ncbi:phage tail protein, partial [Escherichia coli]
RLKNGRWHVMQRVVGKNRYPIDVVKIPMAAPLKQAFDENVDRNGRQNTYFSSLDNMIAQGNPMPVPYGEMLVGSRRISQDISTRDEGGGGKVVVIGRQA